MKNIYGRNVLNILVISGLVAIVLSVCLATDFWRTCEFSWKWASLIRVEIFSAFGHSETQWFAAFCILLYLLFFIGISNKAASTLCSKNNIRLMDGYFGIVRQASLCGFIGLSFASYIYNYISASQTQCILVILGGILLGQAGLTLELHSKKDKALIVNILLAELIFFLL
jgi:hypothetical protein